MSQPQFRNIRQEKLDAENTALNGCRSDLSDVNFTVGQSSYTAKVFGAIALFAIVFGGRVFLRRQIGNPEAGLSATDIGFWILVGCILVFAAISAMMSRKRSGITVSGKTVFSGGNCWTSDDISLVKITRWLERVEVYSDGKKVITFPWEYDRSEVFIAWVKKCGIALEDKRPANDWRSN